MGQVVIPTDENGEGEVVLSPVNIAEIDLIRSEHPVAILTAEPAGWHGVRIRVGGGDPDSELTVTYRGAEGASAAAAPVPQVEEEPVEVEVPKVEPEPDPKPVSSWKPSIKPILDEEGDIDSGKSEEEE